MMFHRTIKFSERFFIAAFFVLGIGWLGYIGWQHFHRPLTGLELIQSRVEQYIEQQSKDGVVK